MMYTVFLYFLVNIVASYSVRGKITFSYYSSKKNSYETRHYQHVYFSEHINSAAFNYII